MKTQRLKLGFLASANGSSARAIVAAIQIGALAAEARLMVSNNRTAAALSFAREVGVPATCIPTQADPEAADARLVEEMVRHDVELIVLSGYLRQLGPQILARYADRILNIHPGPLPEFGGHGMYGRRVHEAVVASGAQVSGICIHLVDAEYDRGPVLARKEVPLEPGESAESLERRVTAMEPAFYVETLRRIAEGSVVIPDIGVTISDNVP